MWNRGKLVIVAIVALALVAASFSLWYHYLGEHRSSDFYGRSTADLFVTAPEAVALRLEAAPQVEPEFEGMEPEPPEGPAVEFNNQFWKVTGEADVAKAKGIANVRHALVQDACYEWRAGKPKQPANWQYALEFNDGRNWATVLFDFDGRQIALAGGKRTATLDPAISENWRQFFEEQQFAELPVEDAPPADTKPEPGKAAGNEPAADAANAGDSKPADQSSESNEPAAPN